MQNSRTCRPPPKQYLGSHARALGHHEHIRRGTALALPQLDVIVQEQVRKNHLYLAAGEESAWARVLAKPEIHRGIAYAGELPPTVRVCWGVGEVVWERGGRRGRGRGSSGGGTRGGLLLSQLPEPEPVEDFRVRVEAWVYGDTGHRGEEAGAGRKVRAVGEVDGFHYFADE